MRFILGLILLTCPFYLDAQYFAQTAPISVATGVGNYHPQIDMTSDGYPAVTWTNQVDKNLYFAKHNGTDFDAPIQLNPAGLQVQSYNWSGPDLAIDGNNIYVVFHDEGYETGHNYIVKSSDNGATWSDTIRVDNLAPGFGQYPDVAAYQDTVWVTMMDHDPGATNPQYVVSRSTDGGVTWEPEVLAGELWTGEACDCCPPEIIVDANRVIVFFRNNNSNIRDIKAVVSTDRGATFSGMFSVDDHNWMISGCPSVGPDANFMSADKAVCIYKTEVSGQPKIFINEYNMQSSTSDALVEVDATVASGTIKNFPQMHLMNGDIGIVWEGGGNGLDVFFNASSSGASGLDPANAINLTDTSATQSKPAIVIDSNGKFHIVYADGHGNDIKYVQVTNSGVGIADQQLFESTVYPTPSDDQVIVSFTNFSQEEFKFELFNLGGERVRFQIGSGHQVIIPKRNLHAGTYIYTIKLGEKISEGKLTFI